ncbi:hypothetical protein E2320_012335 [Naja naja]|nr:hypothetical protein E2320_012335 [Naja naja]
MERMRKTVADRHTSKSELKVALAKVFTGTLLMTWGERGERIPAQPEEKVTLHDWQICNHKETYYRSWKEEHLRAAAMDLLLFQARDQNATKDRPGVHANPHIHHLFLLLTKLLNGFDHAQAHLDAAVSVIHSGLGTPCHTVVAVPQSAYLLALGVLAEAIKAAKEVVQKPHQGVCRFVGTHFGKAHNICKQNTDLFYLLHLEGAKDNGGLLNGRFLLPAFGAGGGVALDRRALAVLIPLLHQIVRDDPGHDRVDHALLQGLLHLQILPVHDGLAHLEEGAPGPHLRHDEEVHAGGVDAEVQQGLAQQLPGGQPLARRGREAALVAEAVAQRLEERRAAQPQQQAQVERQVRHGVEQQQRRHAQREAAHRRQAGRRRGARASVAPGRRRQLRGQREGQRQQRQRQRRAGRVAPVGARESEEQRGQAGGQEGQRHPRRRPAAAAPAPPAQVCK